MTSQKNEEVEVLSAERRRRWSAHEKVAIVHETYQPGMTVSLVARKHGINPNQVFLWRKLERVGALTAVEAGATVVPARNSRRHAGRFASCNAYWARRASKWSSSKKPSRWHENENGLRARPCCPGTIDESGIDGAIGWERLK